MLRTEMGISSGSYESVMAPSLHTPPPPPNFWQQEAGSSMLIISIVNKNRSLSIAVDNNQSTIVGNRLKSITQLFYCAYRLCSIMIDFDWFWSISVDKNRKYWYKKHVWQERGVTAAKDRLIKQYWLCQDLITLLLLYCNKNVSSF